jgi:hypothetical protein
MGLRRCYGGCLFIFKNNQQRKIIMADYYTKFSVILPLPNKEAQTYALELASKAQAQDPSDCPKSFHDVIELWHFETVADRTPESWGIWMNSENGGIDAVCVFIQHLLQKFDPDGRVTFEWSNDCSKPRVDAYGGGAAIITAKEIKSTNTSEWLQQIAA